MLRALTATGAMTQTTPMHPEAGAVMPTGAKRVRVTYENLTNDGFAGISGVDAFAITGETTFELMAYEAGTERNNEKADLIALMGTERDPEGGVVPRDAGLRGEADAPAAWKFDPAKPVARLTITPMAPTR